MAAFRNHLRDQSMFYAEGLALLIAVIAAWLGAHEFVGTWASREVVSCGSVWGMPWLHDLNGFSCANALRNRVTLVAVLVGLAALVALVAPLALRWSAMGPSPRRRFAAFLACGIPIALSVAMVVEGRHLIWSVSGA